MTWFLWKTRNYFKYKICLIMQECIERTSNQLQYIVKPKVPLQVPLKVRTWSGHGQVRSDSNSNSNSNVGPELYTKIGFHHPPKTRTNQNNSAEYSENIVLRNIRPHPNRMLNCNQIILYKRNESKSLEEFGRLLHTTLLGSLGSSLK